MHLYFYLGPDTWHGVCSTGKSQSPIDFPNSDHVEAVKMEPMIFQNYDKLPKGETVKNLGLTVEVNVKSANQDSHPRVRRTSQASVCSISH